MATIAFFTMRYFEDNTIDANERLIEKATELNQETLEKNARELLENISRNHAELLEQNFATIENQMLQHRDYIEYVFQNADRFPGHEVHRATAETYHLHREKYVLAPGVYMNEEIAQELALISNMEYVFRPATEQDENTLMTYVGTTSGIFYSYLASESLSFVADYDPRLRPWYTLAMEFPGEIVWTSPYLDGIFLEGTRMITAALTFNDAQGNIAGVIGIDVGLEAIDEKFLEVQVGDHGLVFFLDNNGDIIVNENEFYPDFPRQLSEAEEVSESFFQALERMYQGEEGFEAVELNGQSKYLSYIALDTLGWGVGFIIDVNEFIGDMDEELHAFAEEFQGGFQHLANRVIFMYILVLVGAVILITWRLHSILVKPIQKLAMETIEAEERKFDYKISTKTNVKEIETLAENLDKMIDSIKKHMVEIAIETRKRERIASDLRIAAEIQMDLLPKVDPALYGRKEMELACFIRPAEEVGGDLYDFFYLDKEQEKLFMGVADVSGSGMQAAWFMVITQVLVKSNKNLPLDELLSEVNNWLAEDNPSCMFLTAFVAVLDLKTGKFTHANAGHTQPMLYSQASGEFTPLSLGKGTPLGAIPNQTYEVRELNFQKGDTIMMYTDGVTEAFNPEGEMFGMEGLRKVIEQLAGASPTEILKGVQEAVDAFSGEGVQSDDITMLCCRWNGTD